MKHTAAILGSSNRSRGKSNNQLSTFALPTCFLACVLKSILLTPKAPKAVAVNRVPHSLHLLYVNRYSTSVAGDNDRAFK